MKYNELIRHFKNIGALIEPGCRSIENTLNTNNIIWQLNNFINAENRIEKMSFDPYQFTSIKAPEQ